MIARSVMRRNVVKVPESMTLRDLGRLLVQKGISGAPVVDSSGTTVGVISQTDLIRSAAPRSGGIPPYYRSAPDFPPRRFPLELPDITRVRDVMNPLVLSAVESTPVRELAKMMLRKRIHRILITRSGRISGIVSSLDLLEALLEEGAPKAPKKRRSP